MKTNNKILILIIIATLHQSSCIEEFGGTGTPFNRHEQVLGTWVVSNVVQRDLLAENPLYQTLDVTNAFDFSQYTLTVNEDGTFAVSNTGNAPDFIITSGTWAFDHQQFPSAILLTGTSATSRLDFGSLNSLTESNQLQVNYVRSLIIPGEEAASGEDEERETVVYEYTLSRPN